MTEKKNTKIELQNQKMVRVGDDGFLGKRISVVEFLVELPISAVREMQLGNSFKAKKVIIEVDNDTE